MIHQITVTPISGNNHTTRLSGRFFDTKSKQNIVLTSPYGVAIGRELTPSETEFKFWFNETTKKLVITWDDTKESDKSIGKFVDALKKHDSIACEGNYNLNFAQFTISDSRQAHLDKVSLIKARGQVFNLVNNMKESEMIDVAFFSGRSPVRKTTEEIFAELCDFQDGILMQNPVKFLNDWRMTDRSHIIYARKAEALKIVINDGGTLKINGEIIGSTTDDVVAYLKTNEKMYDYVKKEVGEKDFLPIGANKDNVVSKVIGKEQEDEKPLTNRKDPSEVAQGKADRKEADMKEDDELKALKMQARELGIMGFQSPYIKAETLRKKIEEKKLENQKKELAHA